MFKNYTSDLNSGIFYGNSYLLKKGVQKLHEKEKEKHDKTQCKFKQNSIT